MNPADIASLVEVADPRVSPDGTTIAFTVTTVDDDRNAYKSRVWLVPADGSARPRPFTSGQHRDGRPRWSPDGTHLAFVTHREDKGSQLFVLPVGVGGEAVPLVSWPEEIEDVQWSPEGDRLAFTARVREEERYGKEKAKDQPPRRLTRLFSRLDNVGWTVDRPRQLYVVPADASAPPRALTTDLEFQVGTFSWTGEGTIVFTSARHESRDEDLAVDLFIVDVEGGPPDRLTKTEKTYARPSWGPLGVAFHWNEPLAGGVHSQIGVVVPGTGRVRLLTESLDRQCAPFVATREPVWDGIYLWFLVEDAGNVHLYRVTGDGAGKPEAMVTGDRTIKAFDKAGGTLAFTATTGVTLSELFVHDPDGNERKLSSFGREFHQRVRVSTPERFTATSTDGSEVEAWAIPPIGVAEGERYPTLLNIHGGPFTQYGNTFFDEFQMQAGAGYGVLYANPRGSSGYSQAWGQAIRGPAVGGSGWGGVDCEDLMAVVDAALERYRWIDGDRLGVMGGSYGGFMTSWIIGHTDRFVAACSERGVNNVLSLEYASDVATVFRGWIGVSHLEDPEEYQRQSPITFVKDITTPVLIVHSEEDLRCPIEQAEQLFVALKMLGREVEFLRFPGEGHELSRSGSPYHRQVRMEAILEWFDRHLK